MGFSVSIVIPTFNRLDVLPEVMDAVEAQEGCDEFEVVVVDDGSTDGTGAWLKARSFRRPVQLLSQQNAGPAVARNAGVRAARAPRVAFLGDDTVPQPGWLAAHQAAHARLGRQPEQAVIGYTRWHPRMRLSPFLRYINEHGLQFGYRLIEDPDQVPFNFFYTSNLSLSREMLLEEPFDPRFPYAAWEDIETSYRLFRRGMRLAYEPSAITEHDHPTDLARFAQRQEKAGYSAVVFYRLHPELGGFLGLAEDGPPPVPSRGPQWLLERLVRALQYLPVRAARWWERVLRFHYIRGLHRGWRDSAGLKDKENQP